MEPVSAMSAVVTALQGILSTDAMFANLAQLIPVMGGVLLFVFTYTIIKKMTKGASKARFRI